jgi:hypothetical protein
MMEEARAIGRRRMTETYSLVRRSALRQIVASRRDAARFVGR